MTTTSCEELVFSGLSNQNSITVYQSVDGVLTPVEFMESGNETSRIVVDFKGTTIDADSDDSSVSIDWTQGNGLLVFDFSALNVPAGRYKASLIKYSPNSPDGLVLLYAETHGLRFRFV